ncbi:MAG: hypothetical protein ER33_07865 [Cyanobium sp. CACIAM 14]|nr:MAG: hypothetical protein ER33_07865 [Cyanobium sp. CACIAM 14]
MIADSENNTIVTFVFGQKGIDAINAARLGDGRFAFGARNSVEDALVDDYVFGGSGFGDASDAQLILTTDQPAPDSVPSPLPVFGAAAAFGYSRKVRARLRSSTVAGASGIA